MSTQQRTAVSTAKKQRPRGLARRCAVSAETGMLYNASENTERVTGRKSTDRGEGKSDGGARRRRLLQRPPWFVTFLYTKLDKHPCHNGVERCAAPVRRRSVLSFLLITASRAFSLSVFHVIPALLLPLFSLCNGRPAAADRATDVLAGGSFSAKRDLKLIAKLSESSVQQLAPQAPKKAASTPGKQPTRDTTGRVTAI